MKKRSKLLVLIVVLISLALLTIMRWNAWFVSTPEETYILSDKIQRVILTPGESGTSSRTISWVTGVNKNAKNSHVELRSVDDKLLKNIPIQVDTIATDGGVSIFKHAQIDNLLDGAYVYVINDNNHLFCDTFKISNEDIGYDTLIYLGDIQESKVGEISAYIKNINNKYRNITAWVFGGDQIERPSNKYWEIWYQHIENFASNTPLITVSGNHEYQKGLCKKIDKRWVSTFNYPKNGPTNRCGRSYFIDYPNYRVICIDSDGVNLGPSLISTRKWLKKVLKSKGDKFALVVFHHPIHSVRSNRFNLLMRWGFKNILENPHYGADIILQGHDHAYSRIISKDNKKPVYIVSVCSSKFYRNGFGNIHDKLGAGFPLFQVIEVSKDSLKYSAYDENFNLYDSLLITKYIVKDFGRKIPERFVFNFKRKDFKKFDEYNKKVKHRNSNESF